MITICNIEGVDRCTGCGKVKDVEISLNIMAEFNGYKTVEDIILCNNCRKNLLFEILRVTK